MVEFVNGRVVAVELANDSLPAKRTTILLFFSMPTHMPVFKSMWILIDVLKVKMGGSFVDEIIGYVLYM